MVKNGKVEICGMHEGKWIRIEGTVKEDLRREARVAMPEENPSLKSLASPDNGTMTVFFFDLFLHGCAKGDCLIRFE